MKPIVFIDVEVNSKNKASDYGAITNEMHIFHNANNDKLVEFISKYKFFCGHKFIEHDSNYIKGINFKKHELVDTLYLSPLLFPKKPYHSLGKNDKYDKNELNNPVNDCKKTMSLLEEEIFAFHNLEEEFKEMYYHLLKDQIYFTGFFNYIKYKKYFIDIISIINNKYKDKICHNADLKRLISKHPIELAYALAIINHIEDSLTPAWVLRNFPNVENILHELRSKPCVGGCKYCNDKLDEVKALNFYFNHPTFRPFNGINLQHDAVKAAINNKSILAVFPTGGGKSLTFQLPALMQGSNESGLTVVISPLQSLMKDQVDSLEKIGLTNAVTINGLLDPVERTKAFERVADGGANILYISPEILRSKPIETLLLKRNVVRFVIDEAHCFSAWGQDFRVDYLYIGDFIKNLEAKKQNSKKIAVSCFTATAKPKVIEDIKMYFRDKMSIELEMFVANSTRENLKYHAIEQEDDAQKFNNLRLLLANNDKPTIIYVSRTKTTELLSKKLNLEGYSSTFYNGRLDNSVKVENQNAFMDGKVNIIVATTAFGMGVNKSDVSTVIHYDISDSLENYVQEAGRAGRQEEIKADCYVLFNENDLNNHFTMLNQSKLSLKEIAQIWKAIKYLTRTRQSMIGSTLEIARAAGWDEQVYGLDTKVKTAINALEQAGYVKREQNVPRVFADALTVKSVMAANEIIYKNEVLFGEHLESAKRIISRMVTLKHTKESDKDEARVDHMAVQLGLEKDTVITVINLLREVGILEQFKDLHAYIKTDETEKRPLDHLNKFRTIEKYLMGLITTEPQTYNLKEITEKLEEKNKRISIKDIKLLLNYLEIEKIIDKRNAGTKNHYRLNFTDNPENISKKHESKFELAVSIIEYLYEHKEVTNKKDEIEVNFSFNDIKEHFESSLLGHKIDYITIEKALYFLKKTESLRLESAFLITYNGMQIKRLQLDNQIQYKKSDYKILEDHYQMKKQQIHIVGEYAKKLINDYTEALIFVNDYFTMNYDLFINKYFKNRKTEINRTLTPAKFNQLFKELSPSQFNIIKDGTSKHIVVAAGPGSGKTRILVHKLASLYLMEDVKHEQMLMLTFSRAAAVDFKKKLINLLGPAAHYIQITTFHSYCFDLLEKIGSIEKSNDIINDAVIKINDGEVDLSRITKTVLVIDEGQDMSENEFSLVKTLMEKNDDLRVIVVGDDDQNIYKFRGSSSKYLHVMMDDYNATKYELIENYRSAPNLVDFSNIYISQIKSRLKKQLISAVSQKNGIIKYFKYISGNLTLPVVNQILNESIKGSIAVLTKTNEDALNINALLVKEGINSKLLQSVDGFRLIDLDEFHFLLKNLEDVESEYLSLDVFHGAVNAMVSKFSKSENLEPVKSLLKDYRDTNKNLYLSELKNFIYESKYEDLYKSLEMNVVVSTIHQAKGREFDNVILVLGGYSNIKEEDIRTIYVGLTRARQNLYIHDYNPLFEQIKVESFGIYKDNKIYDMPNEIIIDTKLSDVQLGYAEYVLKNINGLFAGYEISVDNNGCSYNEKPILKFSKKFTNTINDFNKKGYMLSGAKVKNIVHWMDKETFKTVKLVLPILSFIKINEFEEVIEKTTDL